MVFVIRSSFTVVAVASVWLWTFNGTAQPRQRKGSPANTGRPKKKPVHLLVRSRADIKQTFTYSPYPVIPGELQGYTGSQVGGTGTYRLSIDPQGGVTQVTILKRFTVAAVYDERFSNLKGNPVPGLDQVMLEALKRWRAKPGPPRVVDIYWSFGTQSWLNYGKPNSAE